MWRALSLAIDRRSIISGILAGGQIEAYSFTPAAVAGSEPPVDAASMSQAQRDALAAELTGLAGFGSDNPLQWDLVYNTNEGTRMISETIGRMWKRNSVSRLRSPLSPGLSS